MHPIIEQHRAELEELCRRFHVESLSLFGSAAKGTFRPGESDLDFLVRFSEPGEPGYAKRYLRFAEALEALFGHEVDLLIDQPFRNPYFQEEIDETRQSLYGAHYEEAAV